MRDRQFLQLDSAICCEAFFLVGTDFNAEPFLFRRTWIRGPDLVKNRSFLLLPQTNQDHRPITKDDHIAVILPVAEWGCRYDTGISRAVDHEPVAQKDGAGLQTY